MTKECTGPPLVMYNFYASDLSNSTQPKDEYWPIGYQTVNLQFYAPMVVCGSISCSYISSNGIACYNPLDDSFLPYESFSFVEIENIISEFPPGTENTNYCHLSQNEAGSLFGMKEAYLLDSGECIDGTYRCFSNGTLMIYANDGCTSNPLVNILEKKIKTYNSHVVGNFSASKITIPSQPSIYQYRWNAWVPDTILVPRFKLSMEIFSAICFAFGFLLALYSIISQAYEMTKCKNIKLFQYNQLICYIFIFNRIILDFFFWILILDSDQIANLYGASCIHGALGSLFLVCLCTHIFLFEIQGFKPWQQITYILVLLGLHIGLMGSSYISYYANGSFGYVTDLYYSWVGAEEYWNIFVGIYLIILPMLIIYKFLSLQYEKSSINEKLKILLKIDKGLVFAFIMQIMIQILSTTFSSFILTDAYRDDRVLLAIYGPLNLLSMISTYLIIRVAIGIRSVAQHRNPSKEKISATMVGSTK